jgi:hypothetical protein
MNARLVLPILAALICGCATKHPPMQPITTTQVVGVPASDIVLTAPQIVVDETPGGLFGHEITPEDRSSTKEAWAKRVRASADGTADGVAKGVAYTCLRAAIEIPVVGLLACPVMIVGGVVFVAGAHGVAQAKASGSDAALLLPETTASRFRAAYKDQATAATLAQRISPTAPSRPIQAGASRDELRIRMQSMDVVQTQTKWLVVRVSAEAQGSSTGAQFTPTEHIFEWSYRLRPRAKRWDAEDDELLDQVLDQALDALANSIASTYGL